MEKIFLINGDEVKVQNFEQRDGSISFILNGKSHNFELIDRQGHNLTIQGTDRFKAAISSQNRDGESIVMAGTCEAMLSGANKKSKRSKAHAGSLTSPMPGKIFKILKEAGSEVAKGEAILILEAMKMEHSIRADKDGKVKKIFFKVGDLVQGGVTLAEVE